MTSVVASGTTAGLTSDNAQLLAMLSVAPTTGSTADPGAAHNLTWTFNSTPQAFDYLAVGQSLVLTYTVQSTDSSTSPLSDTQTVTITINGTSDARVIAPGEVLILSGETLAYPLIQNDGTILVQSNNQSTVLGSIITGTGPGGSIEIKNNSTLQIDGSVDSGQTVFFSVDPGGGANAKLILTDPLNFYAKISDFSGNDQLDLVNFVVSSITYVDNAGSNTGGTLKIFGIFNGNGIVTEVDLIFVDGDKTTANFTFASDGNNGTTIVDPPTSTKAAHTTATPVAETSTLTTTETAGGQTDVSSATVDDRTMVALATAVSDPDGGETTSVTINGNGAAADTTGTVSGSGSFMVNSGAALEFTSISHRVAGIPTDNGTVEVTNTPARSDGAVERPRCGQPADGPIAIASVMIVRRVLD